MKQRGRIAVFWLAVVNVLLLLIGAGTLWFNQQNDVGAGVLTDIDDTTWFGYRYGTGEMKRGIYEVSVRYRYSVGEEDGNAYALSCKAIQDGGNYPLLYVDQQELPRTENEISFRLWVNSDIAYMLMDFKAPTPAPKILIDSIILKRNFGQTLCYGLLRLCCVLLLLDAVVVIWWNRGAFTQWSRKNSYVILGLLGIFCIISADLFGASLTYGHDIHFHLARIAGLAEGLQAGAFPVRIQPGWCNDYGYPVSVFYGDALLYGPALLYLLGVPLMYTYKVYQLVIHLGTIAVSYYCYRKISNDNYIGLTCTALYVLSVNRILNVQTRAAMGEYSAYLFFPLVILGMQQILCEKKETPPQKKNGWLPLAIGMTGILQTHILSFEMVCILLAVTVFLTIGRLWQSGGLVTLMKAAALAIGLSAGFLFPFLDYSQQKLEIFKEDYEYSIQGLGLSLYELFSFPTAGRGEADLLEKGMEGRFPAALGFGVLAVFVLSVIALVRWEWEREEKQAFRFALGLAVLSLWLATCYFPWNRLAAVSGIRNVVRSIQFPWRFLSIAMPLIAYAACLLFVKMKQKISGDTMKYLLFGLCTLCAAQGMYMTDLAVREGDVVLYDASKYLRSQARLMGGEYLFQDAKRSITEREQEAAGQNVTVTQTVRGGGKTVSLSFAMRMRMLILSFLCFPTGIIDALILRQGRSLRSHRGIITRSVWSCQKIIRERCVYFSKSHGTGGWRSFYRCCHG